MEAYTSTLGLRSYLPILLNPINLKLPYKLPFLTGKQYVECLRFLKGKKWSYLHILLVGLRDVKEGRRPYL